MPPQIIENPGGYALGRIPMPEKKKEEEKKEEEEDVEESEEEDDEKPITTVVNSKTHYRTFLSVSRLLLEKAVERGYINRAEKKDMLEQYDEELEKTREQYKTYEKGTSKEYQAAARKLAQDFYLSILDDMSDLIISLPEKGREWANKMLPNYFLGAN